MIHYYSHQLPSGQEKVVPKSKYQEDVFVNGHAAVYGSFYSGGKWGYKCCRTVQKQAYCTGAASRTGADVPQRTEEVVATNQLDRSRPLIEVFILTVNHVYPLFRHF